MKSKETASVPEDGIELKITLEKTQELLGAARGSLLKVAGTLDGVTGMENLRARALKMAYAIDPLVTEVHKKRFKKEDR